MKPQLVPVPASHPSIVKECAYCGVMIKGYSKVYVLRAHSEQITERGFQLHPECLPLFAHWLSEVVQRM